MSRWFRVYDDVVDDPKLQRLSDGLFRATINLWCITSQNGGLLPSVEDIAFKLRTTPAKARKLLGELRLAGLIVDDETGTHPHNWNGRQYKSDVSSERVKRFRERERNVSETPPETETETEADTEQKVRTAKAVRSYDEKFEEAWQGYPKRDGGNPKPPAAKLFLAAVRAGEDPQAIIDGAKRFAIAETRNIGTPYIPQMVKWLRDKRWLDYGAQSSATVFNIRSHLV